MAPATKALIVGMTIVICIASIAHAQDAPGVRVPPDQRALSDILSKYNDLDASAPNEIQAKKIAKEFRKDFCAHIPTGHVSGWIGEIGSVDDRGPNKSLEIDMGVNVDGLYSSSFGVELSIGNYYAYGIDRDNMQPHHQTEIPVDSPLYEMAANFRSGDTIRFNGTFIPYVSAQACYDNDTTRFGLVRFSSFQKIGWGLHLN